MESIDRFYFPKKLYAFFRFSSLLEQRPVFHFYSVTFYLLPTGNPFLMSTPVEIWPLPGLHVNRSGIYPLCLVVFT
jgi:hypothetical protein